MVSNRLEDQFPEEDKSERTHQDGVDFAMKLLTGLHGEGTFDMRAVTQGNVTVVHATDNPKFVRERQAVAEEFGTINSLLEVGESRPEPGSTVILKIGSHTKEIVFDSMDELKKLIKLGLDTVRKHYTLVEAEERTLQELVERYQNL